MSNTTYSSATFKPASQTNFAVLMRELFQATPLYIFVAAAKSAFGKTSQR